MANLSIQPKFYDDARQPGRLQIVTDMPALLGSEKQIAWATEIRAKMAVEFGEGVAKKMAGVAWGAVIKTDVDYIAQCQAKLDAVTVDPKFARAFDALAAAFAIADSRFWIDNRNRDINGICEMSMAYLASK